jgi:class 3 adenylate cyclase/tetratricopeptide (TPR) repeat protein
MSCTHCGQSLGASSPEIKGERRQITLFFSDLVGSTTLSGNMDPEDLQRLYAEYQQGCADIVRRHGGYVAQFLGDGILAYFGYPTAHGDDAVRGVQAGVELLQYFGDTKLVRRLASVRVGIHTGVVVMSGAGGDSRREPLALGEAPNIAARVQSEAKPDTVVVSEATRRLIGEHFMLNPLGSHTLKGISRPVQIFEVLGRNRSASRLDKLAAEGIARFSGRERELALIRGVWAEACTQSRRVLLIRGEAGIGKSRLMGMAREIAKDQLHEVFEVECSPYDMSSAFFPIVTMLRRRLGLDAAAQSPEQMLEVLERFAAGRQAPLEEALPLLADLFSIPTGDRYPPLEMAAARRRQRTLAILADLLQHAPDGLPVLILMEDLHWADPSTRELINALIASQKDTPLCLICTARPESSLPWTDTTPGMSVLDVAPLPQDAARGLIKDIVGSKPLPASVVAEIIERTGGVPLFVEAVTRMILENGLLQEREDRYELTRPLPSSSIPDTVHDSLMARIDRLGPDKSITQLASVIGRQFDIALLQRVSGRTREDLVETLDNLCKLDLFVACSGASATISCYSFKHALIQDVAYESLLRATRQEIHHKIALTLREHFPETLASRPDLLAQHFTKAAEYIQAIEYWLRAGQQALGRAANHEAMAHLKQGLELLDHLPIAQRLSCELDFRSALAPALTATQGWVSDELAQTYRRAGELLDLLPNSPQRLTVLWGTWAYHFVAGHVGESLALAPQVLELALGVGNPLLVPPARHATACSYTYHGDFAKAIEHADAGLAVFDFERERLIAQNFGHASSVCLECFKGDSLWMQGFPDEALAASDRSLDLARRLNHMPSLAWAVSYKTWFHHLLRDPQRIMEMADEAILLSGEEGFAFWEPMVAVYRGWALVMQGRHEEGLTSMRGGLARYRAAGNGCTQVHMLAALAEALWETEHFDEAYSVLREGMGLAITTEEGFYEPELYRLKGFFQLQQARRLAAEQHNEREQLWVSAEKSVRLAVEMARHQSAKSLELRALSTLDEIQLAASAKPR